MKLLLSTCTVLLCAVLSAQPTDLFISEYVEGSSFNKAIELYNGTLAPIDLNNGQYIIEVYFNGNVTSSSLALTGTVAPGSVFILAHPSAVLGVSPNLSTSVINFNGNDAVVLKKGGINGPMLDVIGQVGFNPGTQWGSGDTATLDRTLRRKINICQGDITTSNAFYTSPEWDGFPQNTFNGLGSHTVSCAPLGSGLSVAPSALSFTSTANLPSTAQVYAVTGNSLILPVFITAPLYFEIALNANGPFSSSLSVPNASFSSGSVNIYVRYTPLTAGTNTGIITHSSGSYTANLYISGSAINVTPIAQIQGSTSATAFTGQVIATKGIVVADFQGTNELGGFFIQDAIGDNDAQTSEGIFVLNTTYTVNVGDEVIVSGLAEEFFNRTQIKSVSSLGVLSTGNTLTPVSVTLPFSSANDLEKLEGMLVQFTQSLTVTEVYTLARYGEVALSVNGRLFNPTNFIDPNDQPASGTSSTGTSNTVAIITQQSLNDLSRILLDDKSSIQNPTVVPYLDPINHTLRCGSTLPTLLGIVDYAFSYYRIQPVGMVNFNYASRPTAPGVGNYNVKVASFNVLNYFNGDGLGAGFPTSRGANTAIEFSRQRSKIIEAIKQIDADVIGLMEMENDGNSAQSAIADLVNGLNMTMGAGTYTFVPDPTPSNGGTGTDEIKVALIYKPSILSCAGVSKADNNIVHNRPPLAQTFILNSSQEKFSVLVNHFKSKSCSNASGNNLDLNDGQGCYNDSRKLQATALLNFIDSIQVKANDDDILVIGDLNAYEEEDPNDVLRAGGLHHLLNNSYSYVFMGQAGSLDHAYISSSLLTQLTGADKWHINADEPVAKDYNQEFNPPYLYAADPFRSSDHDPVIIGLKLETLNTGLNTFTINGSENLSMNIQPNPCSGGQIWLDVFNGVADEARIEIEDQLGRTYLKFNHFLNSGKTSLQLNLHSLSTGLYYIVITQYGNRVVKKLVITKQ